MKKTARILAGILCLVMIAAMVLSVPVFADDANKPGPHDLDGASSYLIAPKEGSWLDEYITGYIYAANYCRAAYTYHAPNAANRWKYVYQGTEVTLLAEEAGKYLAKSGTNVFWVNKNNIADHYVAPGRRLTSNAEVDAHGPSLLDMEGVNWEIDRPAVENWLDEAIECYIYAPKHHQAAEMLYYTQKPTYPEAIKKHYDIRRQMGTVEQGTKVNLLAHRNSRYLVKDEYGRVYWIYDWCTSDTYVPYGEAK